MMNVPQASLDAARILEQRSAYRECPGLAAVYVRGDDRTTWLNGQITNDVREIAQGQSVHALAVNVRGKILAELFVADLGEALILLVHKSAEAALLESFERYIIMEDVTLEPMNQLRVLSLEGPDSPALHKLITCGAEVVGFAHSSLELPAYGWIGSAGELEIIREQLSAHAPAIDEPAHELARLRRATPRFGIDFDEHHYPQEAGLKAYVSFNKGCYLGQEVVCTLESRGRLSRHLVRLRGEPGARFEPGAGLTLANAEDQPDPVGTLTSATWDPELGASLALGYVRRMHAAPGTRLLAGMQALTIDKHVGETVSEREKA